MKKLITGIILFTLGLALVAVLSIKIDGKDIATGLSGFAIRGFVAVLALTLLGHMLANWRMFYILRAEGYAIPYRKLFSIFLAGNAFSYTTPLVYLGGEGVKAYLLKEHHDVEWRKSTAMLVVDRILEVTTAFVVIVIAASAFVLHAGVDGFTRTLGTIAVAIFFAVLLGAAFYSKAFRNKTILEPAIRFFSFHKTRAGKFMTRAERDVVKFFHRRDKYMWYGWIISAVKQVILFTRHAVLFFYLGKGIVALAPLASLGALFVGYVFPVPAALGIQEAFQGILFAVFGFKAGEGLALSFVLRGADIIIVSLGIIILVRHGLSLITKGAMQMLRYSNGNGNGNSNGHFNNSDEGGIKKGT